MRMPISALCAFVLIAAVVPVSIPAFAAEPSPALLDPSLAADTAPESFKVKLETTKGDVIIEVTRAWAPNGADRFYNLVKIGYYDGAVFFRVVESFMAQVGMHGVVTTLVAADRPR